VQESKDWILENFEAEVQKGMTDDLWDEVRDELMD